MNIQTQSVDQFLNRGKIAIGIPGIKKSLKRYTPEQAIAEYIWNGFDAGAKEIRIDYEEDQLGGISRLTISDNGHGIPLPELEEKFRPFMHSNKLVDPEDRHLHLHGKNGRGRLTFFTFADSAQWDTTYRKTSDECRRYKIKINSSDIDDWNATKEAVVDNETGTIVAFTNVHGVTIYNLEKIEHEIARVFASFLEAKTPFERKIFLRKKQISHKSLIASKKDFVLKIEGEEFDIHYVRWTEKIQNEYSKFYFIDSNSKEKARKTTSFNKKSDGFHHSVYITSKYFDNLQDDFVSDSDADDNGNLFSDDITKSLIKELNVYLSKRRKIFLKEVSSKLVEDYRKDNIFPKFSNDTWDQYRKSELEYIVKNVYEAEPRILNGLNLQQKKTMVRLFSLVMNSDERDSLLDVLSQVVDLEKREIEDLSKILKTSQLSNIIATIKMVSDRVTALDQLKKMVFNKDFDANERDNLQAFIAFHYWIFGEQYHIVTEAEPDFEEALRRFIYLLHGKKIDGKIDHLSKEREMDVFAVRCLKGSNKIENIVVEIKHPSIILGKKELDQVKEYMSVTLDEDKFNGKNYFWEFYLVGNSSDDYISREFENIGDNGEKNLIYKIRSANYKIYLLTWSEVIANFEIRHNFLLDRLQFERNKLASTETSADDVLVTLPDNTASTLYNPPPVVPLVQ